MPLTFNTNLGFQTLSPVSAFQGGAGPADFASKEAIKNYYSPTYSRTRGLIAPKGYAKLDEVLLFQFNPEVISDIKETEWNNRSYTGFSGQDYIWAKGGERKINFKLFFDATPGTNNTMFGKNTPYGNLGVDTLDQVYPRGVMPMVEGLTKFLYPIKDNPNAPSFSSGGVVPTVRFLPPPIAIFVFGDIYLEGILSDVQTSYTLFNTKLQPVRAECNVTFKVIEVEVVKVDANLTNKASNGQ